MDDVLQRLLETERQAAELKAAAEREAVEIAAAARRQAAERTAQERVETAVLVAARSQALAVAAAAERDRTLTEADATGLKREQRLRARLPQAVAAVLPHLTRPLSSGPDL